LKIKRLAGSNLDNKGLSKFILKTKELAGILTVKRKNEPES
jgi:hypothetical protein